MSCENPGADGDTLMARRVKFDGKTKICVKCKETRGNVVVRYAVYCKSCFISVLQTRFKKSLEPSVNQVPDGSRRKALDAAGSLVIGFSGGTCSTTLLDLVAKTYFSPRQPATEASKGGKDHPRNTELRVWKNKPAVCYVEVCSAFSDDKVMTEIVRAAVARYPGTPFDFIPLRLEDSFDPTWWESIGREMPTHDLLLSIGSGELPLNSVTTTSSAKDPPILSLRRYLASLPTQTAFFSSIQTLIRMLLLHTAASRQASHLLLGTSLTSLSVNLISSIAQGSGFAVVEEIQEEWLPPSPGIAIRVVRPLRDVGMKDCAIWNWWRDLRPISRPLRVFGNEVNAIDTLTRDFIFGLESDYPATVSTIARTCAKLTAKGASDVACILCARPVQLGVEAWKERISIRSYVDVSSVVSEDQSRTDVSQEEVPISANVDASALIGPHSLTPFLCYACHTTLTSRSSRGASQSSLIRDFDSGSVLLPMWAQHGLIPSLATRDLPPQPSAKMDREDMRTLIEDSLISE